MWADRKMYAHIHFLYRCSFMPWCHTIQLNLSCTFSASLPFQLSHHYDIWLVNCKIITVNDWMYKWNHWPVLLIRLICRRRSWFLPAGMNLPCTCMTRLARLMNSRMTLSIYLTFDWWNCLFIYVPTDSNDFLIESR